MKRGDLLFAAGDFYPGVAMVVDGLLSKSFSVENSSKDRAMCLLLPGAVFGESFFLSQRPSNLEVEALRDTMLLELDHACITSRMLSGEPMLRRLLDFFMLNTESDLEGLATVLARGHEERLRLLQKILIVRERVLPNLGWYEVPVNLSHEEMGRVVYVTPLTVNRILHEWKEQGLYKRVGTTRLVRSELLRDISDWKAEKFLEGD